jgi:hypothetical protein
MFLHDEQIVFLINDETFMATNMDSYIRCICSFFVLLAIIMYFQEWGSIDRFKVVWVFSCNNGILVKDQTEVLCDIHL